MTQEIYHVASFPYMGLILRTQVPVSIGCERCRSKGANANFKVRFDTASVGDCEGS